MHSKSEDLLFSFINKLPENVIPYFLMNWMEHYTNKRIAELKQQIVHDKWRSIALDKVVDNFHVWQQDIKQAPSEE